MCISRKYLFILSHQVGVMLVGEERRLVEGRGGESLVIEVR
jgi:hypothetical protein